MKQRHLISLWLVLVALNAKADFEARIDSNNPVSIPVRSHLVDKSIYARSDALSSQINIKFRGQCDEGWLQEFGLKLGEVIHMFPGINGDNKSISGNNGSSWANHVMSGQEILSADNPSVIQACNDHLNTKVNQGIDIESILSSDFSVQNADNIPLDIKYFCEKRVGFSDPPKTINVGQLNVAATCKASHYETPVVVDELEFRIDKQVTLGGLCKVNLKGALSTNKPNQTVRFRYEHIDKAFKKRMSKTHQVITDQQGYANFSHEYPVANGPGKESGKMRVLGVSHEFQSAQRSYKMNCNSGGIGALQQATNSTISLKIKPIKSAIKAFGNQLCPTKVKIIGKVKAGSDISARAVFIGESIADINTQNFSVKKGKTKRLTRVRNLTWSAPSTTTLGTGGGVSTPLMKQNIMQGLNILAENSQNIILSFPRKAFPVTCHKQSVQPGLQIQNTGFTTLPSHTGGGAPTDLQTNQQTTRPKFPVKTTIPVKAKIPVKTKPSEKRKSEKKQKGRKGKE
ncbi:MAG: hypothetical protein KUG78_11240 [Kangiellaceae bacterium]|nr:hypothetical protein [Kangiellaceae bacterium]